MTTTRWTLIGMAAATVLCELLVALSHVVALRTVGALPLILLLPGAAFLAAVDNRGSYVAGGLRLLWSVAISIAIAIFLGLILNVVSDLDRLHWAIGLGAITATCLLVSAARTRVYLSHSATVGEHEDLNAGEGTGHPNGTQPRQGRVSTRSILFLGAAAAIVVASIALSQNSVTSTNPKFLELWMIPPTLAAGGHAHSVEIGVRNVASSNVNLVVKVSEGSHVIFRRNITQLAPNADWTGSLTRSGTHKLVATLSYQSSPSKVVRYVDLKVPTSG
jgi:hypothetical protein